MPIFKITLTYEYEALSEHYNDASIPEMLEIDRENFYDIVLMALEANPNIKIEEVKDNG
jgi:hypothetical protein